MVGYSDWVGLTVLGSAAEDNAVDLLQADDHGAAILVVTANAAGVTLTVEESDDGSTGWVAVPAPQVTVNDHAPLVLVAAQLGVFGVNFMRSKRYVRVNSTTGSATYTGVIISRKKYAGS